MKHHTHWFSLIEIIVSSIILTIGLFGVYKLIANNMVLIDEAQNKATQKNLILPMKECLASKKYTWLTSYSSGDTLSVNFWTNLLDCQLSTYNTGYTFSGVTLDNETYFLYGKVIEKTTNNIKLELNIYSEKYQNSFSGSTQENTIQIYK